MEKIIRDNGKWDEVGQLDTNALSKIIQEKKCNETLLQILREYLTFEQSKR